MFMVVRMTACRISRCWTPTGGRIGFPKNPLATSDESDRALWPELYALNGRRVWLSLRGDRVVGVEMAQTGWTCFEAVGVDYGDGIMALDIPPWDKPQAA
jgi:hypothetical protein